MYYKANSSWMFGKDSATVVWLYSGMRLEKNSLPRDEKENNPYNHSETPSFDAKAYNLAERPLSVTCLLWSLRKPAQIRPSWKPPISVHTCSVWVKLAVKLSQTCLCYTCFILCCSYKVPARSMLYPKPVGTEKTFPVIAVSDCQQTPQRWVENKTDFSWGFSGYT